ncbi:hypothetical protein FDA52_04715 [Clostridium botulinum]|nr:hypothetical protein [Clostridium botulinum]
MCTVLGVARSTYLSLCAITVKKYKPHSSKKVAEGLKNFLKRDFTTSSINYMTPSQCELLARSAA